MATDGTKIIDGDTAHDTYWGIMDLYDSEAPLTMIIEEYPLVQKEFFDEFDNEIYVTSCGLAYWEIGLMTADKLSYINEVISKNACVEAWTELSDNEGKLGLESLKTLLKRSVTRMPKLENRKNTERFQTLFLMKMKS